MSDEFALLNEVAEKLRATGVPYMVAGSMASSYYGEPRATNDIDMVIDPTPEQLDALIPLFADGFYVSGDAARKALATRAMFNVIDHDSGMKIDFIVRKNRPFSEEEFNRRQERSLRSDGATIVFASLEDVILSKLEWSVHGESERQFRDAAGVALLNSDAIDWEYLAKWAEPLQVEKQFQRLRDEVADRK